MEPDRKCPRCGRTIPWGQTQCPFCPGHGGFLWSLRRDTFLGLVFVSVIILFLVTGFTVKRYHAMERGLGQQWFARGELALRAMRPDEAVSDFRNALAYERENSLYQLRLAQALAGTSRAGEARAYLTSLRDRDTGNGPVNLELARLAARENSIPEAVQYYHDAVYSEWPGDPAVQRRAVRLELINFLLNTDQKAAARAELIAVAANLPPDAGLQIQAGNLLLRAEGYDDALRLFRQALTEQRHSAPALAGAGQGYFLSGQYAQAVPYLEQALKQDPHFASIAAMLETARAVLDIDPYMHRLGERERERRARLAFDIAMARLQDCAAQREVDLQASAGNPLQAIYAQASTFQTDMRRRLMIHDAELVPNTMDLVFDMEKAATNACGEPQGRDLALVLMSREQEGGKQ